VAYATVDELTRRLGIAAPTTAQQDQAQQCLDAATQEIDSHLGWLASGPPLDLTAEQQALLEIVNIDRAAEHWRLVPFGTLTQGPELPSVITARDSWYRHGRKLASLQTSWGVG
jgi:cob(I)alamin adenosyltransferase